MNKKKIIEYKNQYNKDNYTACNIRFRGKEAAILSEYSQNLNISKKRFTSEMFSILLR